MQAPKKTDYPPSFTDHRAVPPIIASTTTGQSSSKHASTYKPTTGLAAHGRKDSDKKQESVATELEGFWTLEADHYSIPGTSLWDTFFPDDNQNRDCLNKLEAAGFYEGGRWKIPRNPTGKGKPLEEPDIVEAFVPIFNEIILMLNMAETRVAVDSQNVRITTDDGSWLRPDIFLWGKGSPAFPHIDGKPQEKPKPRSEKRNPVTPPHQILLQKKQKKSGLSPKKPPPKAGRTPTPLTQSMPPQTKKVDSRHPAIDWPWCRVPIEIKTSAKRGSSNKPGAFTQLGAYAREVFTAQPNRRFVPSLILTEHTAEFLLWDRGGVVVSDPIDYHAQASLFCRALTNFVTWDPHCLGFDTTVFYSDGHGDPKLHIRTRETVDNSITYTNYVIEETMFRSYTLRGRGTTCWRVRRPDDEDENARYIIQDSWVEGGMGAERDILRKVEAARINDGVAGVAEFIHIEDVVISRPGGEPYRDTVNHNRRIERFAAPVELIHTRKVLRCTRNCTALDKFEDPQELADTLYDVVHGMHGLYDKAKVLHRDIVPWNILMQRGAPEGSRGILIDFSSAVFVTSPILPARSEMTPGSYLYWSRNFLRETGLYSHLDDLESFYWLLISIIGQHRGPDLAKTRLKDEDTDLGEWMNPRRRAVAKSKGFHLEMDFGLEVQEWYSPLQDLAKKLHGYFQGRRLQVPSRPRGEAESSQDLKALEAQEFEEFLVRSSGDFADFLARFDEAFKEPEPCREILPLGLPQTGPFPERIDVDEVDTLILATLDIVAPPRKPNQNDLDLLPTVTPLKRPLEASEKASEEVAIRFHKRICIHDTEGKVVEERANVLVSYPR